HGSRLRGISALAPSPLASPSPTATQPWSPRLECWWRYPGCGSASRRPPSSALPRRLGADPRPAPPVAPRRPTPPPPPPASAPLQRPLLLDDALPRRPSPRLRPRRDAGGVAAPVAGMAASAAGVAGPRVHPAGAVDDRVRGAAGIPELRCALRATQPGPPPRA